MEKFDKNNDRIKDRRKYYANKRIQKYKDKIKEDKINKYYALKD